MLPAVTGAVAALFGSRVLWLTVRQYLWFRECRDVQRIRAERERERYQWAERLADKYGPRVLQNLPELASVLRDDRDAHRPALPTFDRVEPDTSTPVRRWRRPQ